jgi:hypothetical protein
MIVVAKRYPVKISQMKKVMDIFSLVETGYEQSKNAADDCTLGFRTVGCCSSRCKR